MSLPPCLLTYAFSTYPTPLQTSTASQTQLQGVINLAVSSPTKSIYCDQIEIAVPVGDTETDLTTATPTVGVNTGKWVMESFKLVPGGDLGQGGGSYAVFTFKCQSESDYLINYNLVLGLQAPVNLVPGDFNYLVRENSGTSADPSTFTAKANTYKLTKTTPQFYLQNFVAAAVASPTVPATQFANGAAFTLSWESNGTFYQLYEKGNPEPIYAGSASSYTLAGGLKTDTTFILVASVSGDPANDTPSGGYQSLYRYGALTLTITNPDLTPSTVTATGQIHSNSLVVDNTADINSATVNDGLTVNGGTKLNSATVNTLTAVGLKVLSQAQVSQLMASQSSLGQAQADSLNLQGGPVQIRNVGDNYALIAACQSPGKAAGWFFNTEGAGVLSQVQDNQVFGFSTNGQYHTFSNTTVFTQVPTRSGHRVVTAPMSLEVEVQFSGQARLEHGSATVHLAPEVQDMIHAASYRVLLTPTGECSGLAVVHKAADHFTVAELGHGTSHAGFDWFVIARKPAALGSSEPHAMPQLLPEVKPEW